MSITLRGCLPALFAIVFLTACLFGAGNADAQSLLSGRGAASTTSETDALNDFLDQARKSGARVIVIDPTAEAPPEVEEMPMAMALTSDNLLRARAAFLRMVKRAGDYLPLLASDLATLDDSGSLRWLVNAVLTAIGGLICGAVVFRLVTRWGREHFRALYRPRDPRQSLKIAYLLARAGWMSLSIGIGFATAMLVAVVFDTGHEPTRRAIFIILTTYAGYRFMRSVVFWNFFLPDTPSHRFVNLADEAARRIFRDLSITLAVVAVIVGLCRWVRGLVLNVDFETLVQIAGLLVCALIFMGVAIRHRHDLQSAVLGAGAPGSKPGWRRLLAYATLPVVIAYLILAWFISSVRLTLGLPGGYIPLAAPFIVFVIAVFAYAVLRLMLEAFYERRAVLYRKHQLQQVLVERRAWRRAQKSRKLAEEMSEERREMLEDDEFMQVHVQERPEAKIKAYFPVFKPFFETAIQATIFVVCLGELARLWGADLGRDGGHPIAAVLDVVLVVLVVVSAYRCINAYIDMKIIEEGGSPDQHSALPGETDSEGGVGQSRLATLLPILRNVLTALVLIVGATASLSFLGVNVAPLFAGAGVVGIAIGFGAQTLIRDIFSGAFFLIDDAFRKGEYIEIDQVKGVVEKISVRSFQLRHHLGAVHTIPFGEIRRLTNYSRDWVMMKLPLRVTYDTDVEKVRKLIKKLGQELLKDETIGPLFLQPLKSQGVYKMEDSAMIIRVKYMTRPGDQFVTRKVIYAAIRELFEREGIHFAHREVTVRLADGVKTADLTREQKEAIAGSVRSMFDEEDKAPGATAGDR